MTGEATLQSLEFNKKLARLDIPQIFILFICTQQTLFNFNHAGARFQ